MRVAYNMSMSNLFRSNPAIMTKSFQKVGYGVLDERWFVEALCIGRMHSFAKQPLDNAGNDIG